MLSIFIARLMLNRKTKINYAKYLGEMNEIYNEVLERTLDVLQNTKTKIPMMNITKEEPDIVIGRWVFYINVCLLRFHKFVTYLDICDLGYLITLRQFTNVLCDRNIISKKNWHRLCTRISGAQNAMFNI